MAPLRPTKFRLTGATAVSLAAALALAGCAGQGGDSSSGGDKGTVKLGFVGDLTGPNSGIVIPPRNGAKMAIDAYNKTNPKTKIELVPYDSQGKEDQATALARKATTEDKVAGIIGPAFSGESKAAVPVLESAKVPSISPSATNPDLAKNGWKFWHRVVANDNDQGPAVADFLVKAKKPKKAFVLNDDQDYSVGIAAAAQKEFAAKGVQVKHQKFEQDEKDYGSIANAVKTYKPDVIFFGGYYAQGGRLLKAIRDAGSKATFASGDGSYDQHLVSGAGKPAAEGAVLTCPCEVDPKSDFAAKFKKATGSELAIYGAEGYDAATAFINAVKAGNTTPDKINTYLKTINFKGESKPIKFKPNGEPQTKSVYVYEVINGKLQLLGDSKTATLK